MEYNAYVKWCEENCLPAMDYTRWECGYFMRGMDERRDQVRQWPLADVNTGTNNKGVEPPCGSKY